ncbi:hypothetical protein C9374_008834 [Naegleria lovaniensis]|uniref:Uncharacterized protein n=1 Tax=Naegleria lovaniensis TaxID=51637 RepID=A0AA88GHT3_NAELO|nr:uncharacterized protein C9374_008834 [Naegleria lovaniensis]KAG2377749.1 hypothetical protein C9374_008834 [Naegleria lovaniensis]
MVRFTKLRDEEDDASSQETVITGHIGIADMGHTNHHHSTNNAAITTTKHEDGPLNTQTTPQTLPNPTNQSPTHHRDQPVPQIILSLSSSTISSPATLSDSLLSVSNPSVRTLHCNHHHIQHHHNKNPQFAKASDLKITVAPPTNHVQAHLLSHGSPNEQQQLHNISYHMERNDELSFTNEGYVIFHNSVNIHNDVANVREKGTHVLGNIRSQHHNSSDNLREESFHMGDEEQEYDLVTDKSLDKIESTNSLKTAGSEDEMKTLATNQKTALLTANNVIAETCVSTPKKMIRTKSNVTDISSTSSQSSVMDPIDSSKRPASTEMSYKIPFVINAMRIT